MFVAVIFVPDFFSTAGSNPSNPSWKGTANFLCPNAELVKEINVEPLANVAPNVDASALPHAFSKLIETLLPVPTPSGSEFRYALLSLSAKSNP